MFRVHGILLYTSVFLFKGINSFLHGSPGQRWYPISKKETKSYGVVECYVICRKETNNEPWFPTSVQFSSVTQSCPTLCDAVDCRAPGFPVHHQLLEFTQTHVHWVGDAIQPSHPLSSLSPPAFNLSQHQGLFQWVSSNESGGQSIGVSASASVLPMNIIDKSSLFTEAVCFHLVDQSCPPLWPHGP